MPQTELGQTQDEMEPSGGKDQQIQIGRAGDTELGETDGQGGTGN